VLRTPRLEYFIKTLQGKIGEYVDEELNHRVEQRREHD